MKTKTNLKAFAGPVDAIPLINVFFLLLVFFMLSSSVVFWPGTKIETQVELPKSRSNSMIAADKLVITITRSNLLFFNDRPVEWANLELQLYDLVHRSKVLGEKRAGTQADEKGAPARSPLVVLRADQRISYSRIVQVISLARSLGLGVYLVTEPEKVGRGRGHRLVNENFD